MGFTRKILAAKEVSPSPVYYTSSFRIDLAESFHMHYRNVRLEFTTEEFRTVAGGFLMAYLEWLTMGKPSYISPNAFLKFFDSKLHPVIGEGCETVRGNELSVELQQHTDYIHLHYRGLKIEFSIDEYLEFAEVVCQAKDEIERMDILKDFPKRVGHDHTVMAKGRVIPNTNSGNFWIGDTYTEDPAPKTRDSMIYDEQLGIWRQQFPSTRSLASEYRPTRVSVLTYGAFKIVKPLIKTVFQIPAVGGGVPIRSWSRSSVKAFFGERGIEWVRWLVHRLRR